jgi:hypothetical protein
LLLLLALITLSSGPAQGQTAAPQPPLSHDKLKAFRISQQ